MTKRCAVTVCIKEGRPGTQPSVYDPANTVGGAEYDICGKPGVEKNIIWRCEEHAKQDRARLRRLHRYEAGE